MKILILAAVLVLAPLAVLAAGVQVVCAPRADVLSAMAKGYNHVPVHTGVDSSGNVIEILVAPGGKTFSVFLTRPDGLSCLIAAGKNWRSIMPADRKS